MDTRKKLINSAKRLFSKNGYYETKVSDIVADAGLSQGTFYIYFKSKEDIFKELVKDMSEKIIRLLKEYASKEDDIETIIKNATLDFFRIMYEEKPIAYIFMFQLIGTNEEFRKLYFDKNRRVRELLNNIVKKGIEKGNFSYKNAENIVNILMGYVRIVYLEYLLKDKASLDEILNMVNEGIDVILKGVKA
jgi:AcrR family transcriptional regulator